MAWSQTWTFLNGAWHEGNPPITGPRSMGFWQAASVFDGARVFEGVMPDLARHAARLLVSATKMGLGTPVTADEIIALTHEGVKKFARGTSLYVKPMIWAEGEKGSAILPDPDDCRWLLCIYEAPMPVPGGPSSLTLASYRRPTLECMPTDAKAGCLYPNNARALREARAKGFDNALVRDMLGNIAETTTSNIFMVKDGVVLTPAPTGAFLNGITRQRVIKLMREAGQRVEEVALSYQHFLDADEIFQSGNYSKVMPITRIENRELQPGPVFRNLRTAYWDFAHSHGA